MLWMSLKGVDGIQSSVTVCEKGELQSPLFGEVLGSRRKEADTDGKCHSLELYLLRGTETFFFC